MEAVVANLMQNVATAKDVSAARFPALKGGARARRLRDALRARRHHADRRASRRAAGGGSRSARDRTSAHAPRPRGSNAPRHAAARSALADLLVVGSVALDTVETPFGKVDEALGGSATFFSSAACFFTPVRLVAVVGDDFPRRTWSS